MEKDIVTVEDVCLQWLVHVRARLTICVNPSLAQEAFHCADVPFNSGIIYVHCSCWYLCGFDKRNLFDGLRLSKLS